MADESFLYLTTTGHQSGEPRQIEIWFVERDGRHYIVSERRDDSKWVKNTRKNGSVRYSVGPRGATASVAPLRDATARVVEDGAEPALEAAARALMDAKYQWSAGLIVELT